MCGRQFVGALLLSEKGKARVQRRNEYSNSESDWAVPGTESDECVIIKLLNFEI